MPVMNAVVLRRHGGPDVLELTDLPLPEPGPGQVRVAVRAVGLNHLDIWVRRGGPAFHLEYPHRLGSDVAGVIDLVGPGIDDLVSGTRGVVSPGLSCGTCRACLSGRDNLCPRYGILGETRSGGYCQYLVVPRQNIAPFPGELSFPEAATSILTFLTAWQMLVGSIGLVAVALLVDERPVAWTPGFIAALAYNGVLASGVAWLRTFA